MKQHKLRIFYLYFERCKINSRKDNDSHLILQFHPFKLLISMDIKTMLPP